MTVDWIRSGLKRTGKTRSGLAKALGQSRAAVTDLLNGHRRLRAKEIAIVSEYLGIEQPRLIGGGPPQPSGAPLSRYAGAHFHVDGQGQFDRVDASISSKTPMAERQHTTGTARLRGKHATRTTSSKNAKHAGLVDPLDAAGQVHRRAIEKSGGRIEPSVLPGDPFERLQKDALAAMTSDLRDLLDLLGGLEILERPVKSELDAHELLHHGLPRAALTSLVDKLHLIDPSEASEALGMSLRTLQRHKSEPDALLDVQQSGRAWKFAEILAKATRVLGSQEEAEQWLKRPAIGLHQERPIDLLTTPAGVKLVEDYLGRLEYDVYT